MTYKPFIIVGMPRTGSNLLFTTIHQHQAVSGYAELFHPIIGERAGGHAIRRGGAALYFDGTADPIDFLRRWVWTDAAAAGDYGAIGFKIFAEYLRGKSTGRLLERLKAEVPGLHVLHVRRANYFDVLVSRLVANMTGSWISYRGDGPSSAGLANMRLAISQEAATHFFRAMEWADAYIESLFLGGPYLRVDYERLAQNVQAQADVVFDYLGVGKRPVETATRKQLTVPKEDLVVNYHELLRHFSGTPYESFFVAEGDAPGSRAPATVAGSFDRGSNHPGQGGAPSSGSLEWLDEAVSTAMKGALIQGPSPQSVANLHAFRRTEPDALGPRPRSTAGHGNLERTNGVVVAARADLSLSAAAATSFGGWCCPAPAADAPEDSRYFFLEGLDQAVRYHARVQSRVQRDDVAAAMKSSDWITRFSGFDFVADLRQVSPGRYRLGVAYEARGVGYEFVFRHRVTIV